MPQIRAVHAKNVLYTNRQRPLHGRTIAIYRFVWFFQSTVIEIRRRYASGVYSEFRDSHWDEYNEAVGEHVSVRRVLI